MVRGMRTARGGVVVGLCVMTVLLAAGIKVNAQVSDIALLVGNPDIANRGDFMQEAMNGAVYGCGGNSDDVSMLLAENPRYFNGTLCDVTFYFLNDVVQGGTSDCSNACVVEQAVAAGHDLIIGVAFGYGAPIQAAAAANPDMAFGIIDFQVPEPNVESFTWREDQMGFLSGVVAGEVAKNLGITKIGAVGGPPIPPVKKFISGYVVGLRDTCPECEIFEVFSQSFGDAAEGESHADLLLEQGVGIAACGGGFTGSMACKKLAANGVYVIGVDVDEYYTTFEAGAAEGSAFLLTSALKSTSKAVQFAIECFLFNFQDCVGKNNLLDASNGGIEMGPCNEACDVYDEVIKVQVDDLYVALGDLAISTNVDALGNIIQQNVTVLP